MHKQSGNALFLILIAVALFAALSYAITQSGRGGGNISKEANALLAAQIVQQATDIQQSIQRAVILGTDIADLELCHAGQVLGACANSGTNTGLCTIGENCLFASDGFNASHLEIPTGAYEDKTKSLSWKYVETAGVSGVNLTGTATNDVLMALDGLFTDTTRINRDLCIELNSRLGVPQGSPANPPDAIIVGHAAQCIDFGSTTAHFYYHQLYEL